MHTKHPFDLERNYVSYSSFIEVDVTDGEGLSLSNKSRVYGLRLDTCNKLERVYEIWRYSGIIPDKIEDFLHLGVSH